MATKIEWDIFDYAARDVLSELLDELGASYREMESLTYGEVTYSRIRDIKMGNKAPVRLSEFIRLSAISHCLPAQALHMVIDRVNELENEEYMSMTQEERDSINEIFEMLRTQQSSADTPEPIVRSTVDDDNVSVAETLSKLKRGDLDIAALEDEHKFDGDGDGPA